MSKSLFANTARGPSQKNSILFSMKTQKEGKSIKEICNDQSGLNLNKKFSY